MELSNITLSYNSTYNYALYHDYHNLNSLFENINNNEIILLKNKFNRIINILFKNKLYCEYYLYRYFITETIREKLFDEPEISKEELELVKKLVEVSEKKKLYGTEKELFDKLRRR